MYNPSLAAPFLPPSTHLLAEMILPHTSQYRSVLTLLSSNLRGTSKQINVNLMHQKSKAEKQYFCFLYELSDLVVPKSKLNL